MAFESYAFTVGDLRCVALKDGSYLYEPASFFTTANAADLEPVLREHHLQPDAILSPYTCLAVRSAGGWILIDTGAGKFVSTTGRLPAAMTAASIPPDEIAAVVITHAHPDHIGGNTDDSGTVAFPNARWVMWKSEWDFWTSPAAQRLPSLFSGPATRNLPPIRERLQLIERETEVAPGVFVVPAPGHTPGHSVVAIESAGQELLNMADTVLHPIHLEHPEWQPVFDMDRAAAATSARRVLDRAAAKGSLVLAFHFDPFPGLGYIEKSAGGWQWRAAHALE